MADARVSLVPMTNSGEKKKPSGSGRKKIEIRKIEKTSSRRVAFSKRRRGLFNKAGDICRLCDANIAIIVFSPTGRLFSFGHPSPDHVIDRFLSEEDDDQKDPRPNYATRLKEEEEEEVGEETESPETLEEEEGLWWEESIEGLGLEELEKYKASLEELRNNVAVKLEELMMRRTCERDLINLI